MREMLCCVAMITFVGAFLVPATASGQATRPDLATHASDIFFNPPGPVAEGTTVQIGALVWNLGICYIDLKDANDEVEYDFSTSAGITGIKIEARMRSRDGANVTANAWVDFAGAGVLMTSSTSWTVQSTTLSSVVIGSGSHTLHFMLVSGQVDVDWLRIRDMNDNEVYFTQAEDYVRGGDTVDSIHPALVTVRVYDGPPALGVQIDGDQVIGDGHQQLESGMTQYMSESGSDVATVQWIAGPAGPHDIYVEIEPAAEGEMTLANNEANKPIDVLGGAQCYVNCPAGDGTSPGPVAPNKSPDLNSDRHVNLVDLSLFAMAFGPPPTYDYCADYNCDGQIGLPDVAMFALHFGHTGLYIAGYCI